MDLPQIKSLGEIAGIGAIALGVVVILLRPLIGTIAGLPKDARASPVKLIAIGCFVIGALGIAASALAFPASAQAQRTETYGTQSPAAIAGRDITISYGLSPEQVQELTQAVAAGAVGPLADRIVDLGNTLGVTQGAAVTMLRIIGEQDVPLEKLPQKLAEVAEQYKQAMDRLATLDPQDPITHDLVQRAQAAIKSGQLDEADQLVSKAELAEVVAAHQAQQLAQQAQAAVEQPLLRAAADRGVRGDIAMTRLHYLEAAQHFQEATDLVPAGHPEEKGGFLLGEARALLDQGDERGDKAVLAKALATIGWHCKKTLGSARP